jgi:hypothetical protein
VLRLYLNGELQTGRHDAPGILDSACNGWAARRRVVRRMIVFWVLPLPLSLQSWYIEVVSPNGSIVAKIAA